MTSTPDKTADTFYLPPGPQLEQGDIFRTELVAPAADRRQRIFRAADGRHGSVVFEEECEGRVFARSDLESLLRQSSANELRTRPFVQTPDGHDEMVVVYARLLRYFVIATQTCDISGEEGPGGSHARHDGRGIQPRNGGRGWRSRAISRILAVSPRNGCRTCREARARSRCARGRDA